MVREKFSSDLNDDDDDNEKGMRGTNSCSTRLFNAADWLLGLHKPFQSIFTLFLFYVTVASEERSYKSSIGIIVLMKLFTSDI